MQTARLLFFVIFWIFTCQPSVAQIVRVDRIKGKKALVEISEGTLKTGEIYYLSSTPTSTSTSDVPSSRTSEISEVSSKLSSRDRLIGVTGNVSSLSISGGGNSASTTGLLLSGRFGWNFTDHEYGTLGSLTIINGAGNSTSSFLIGGFFDYNLGPNKALEEALPGFGGEAAVGASGVTVAGLGGSSTTSATTWYLYPNGFIKWFYQQRSTCLRGDIGLLYQPILTNPSLMASGLMARLGMIHYF
jgi:hypothetical protein